jgi:hypothetical protein
MLKKAGLLVLAGMVAAVIAQPWKSPVAWNAATTYKGTLASGGDSVTYGTFNGTTMYWYAKWETRPALDIPGTFADSGSTNPWGFLNAKNPRTKYTWNGCVTTAGATAQVGVPTWKNGAKGAYTIHHDDLCDMPWTYVQPTVDLSVKYGIPIAWGAITSACAGDDWPVLLNMLNKGIEITCHSYNHASAADQWEWFMQDSLVPDTSIDAMLPDPWLAKLKVVAKGTSGGTAKTTSVGQIFTVNLTTKQIEANASEWAPPTYTTQVGVLKLFEVKKWTVADYYLQVDSAKNTIDRNVYASFQGNTAFPKGKKCEFYIYPFDAFSDSTHAYLNAHGFVAARGGSKSGKPIRGDFYHPFYIDFDAYFLINNDPNIVYPANPHQLLSLEGMIDSIMAQHGYMIRELHAVGDPAAYWGAIPATLYEAHLKRLQTLQNSNDLIVMTPSEAIKYRISANGVTGAAITGSGASYTITPTLATGTTPVLDKYKDEICFIVTLPTSVDDGTWTKGQVTYSDQTHPREYSKKLSAKRWAVYANPFKGAFTFQPGAVNVINGISGKNVANIYSFKNGRLHMNIFAGSYKVALYAPNGKAVRVVSGAVLQTGLVKVDLNVGSLSHGYYILSVEHQTGVTRMPVVIGK